MRKYILTCTNTIGLILMHIGAVYTLITVEFSFELLFLFFVMYEVKIIGATIGLHRYFSHKSFNTGIFLETILALMATFAGQGPIKRWVYNHWTHHLHSDQKKDPHSPVYHNFFYGHVGWLFNPDNYDDTKYRKYNLQLSSGANFIANNFTPIFFMQVPLLYLLGGINYVLVGFVLSSVVSLQVMFLTGSVCHFFGTQPYNTGDNSRNNLFVSLLTNGEGWHNNHHYSPASAKHGHQSSEIDLSYTFIILLERIGLVWNIKNPKKDKTELST